MSAEIIDTVPLGAEDPVEQAAQPAQKIVTGVPDEIGGAEVRAAAEESQAEEAARPVAAGVHTTITSKPYQGPPQDA